MTTYDMRGALRRALTTLGSSLPSAAGSLPSPIAEMGTTEERLAARLVSRLGLEPPVDVERLASTMATVAEKKFPIEIDGLCLDLKRRGLTPKIWLAHGLVRVRRRFTLAHEIGHIVIPWHTGSIVDELEAPRTAERGLYREMEAEANRFAAELLMPSIWVRRTIERVDHASTLMRLIFEVADVSYPAAYLRVLKLGPPGFIGAEVRDGIIVRANRTPGTRARPPEPETLLDAVDMPAVEAPRYLARGDTQYVWWKVRTELEVAAKPNTSWRDTLERMLASLPAEHRTITGSRINAVVGYAIGRVPKGTRVEEIYQRAVEACQNRSDRDRWLAGVIEHPDFDRYLLARAYDRAEQPR